LPLATLTSKGQITIPKNIREELKLHTGDKIKFVMNEQNELVIKPITRKAADVAGLLNNYKKKQAVSVEEMNDALAKHIKKQFS